MWTLNIARLGLSGLFLLAIAVGCSTPSERIARYIEKNPERPSVICAALERQTVHAGMTQKEVRLSLGAPNRIDRGGTEQKPTETWLYFQPRDKERDKRGSSFWALDVPKATVYFSAAELVKDAVFYSSGGVQPQKRRARRKTKPVQIEPPRAPRDYDPKPEELGVKGLPKLTLGGVSAMGRDRSAILNRELFAPGEVVEGVTVTAVYPNGVLLAYQGKRVFLRTGETTE
ncbi:MAG: hypothetical protein HN341_02665 [Verrucomicrobia bacterium]|jgi:hypothetical protein|nr:hypothetical protein [Verrucomicrobiota bacterium]